MTQESQPLDPYAVVLADLRAKRDKIDQAIRAIEELQGPTSVSPSSNPAKPAEFSSVASGAVGPAEGPGAFLGMTVADATKKLLQSRRQTLGNAEIVAALERGGLVMNSVDKLNTVGSILMRRFNQTGDIVRVSRGVWGLQEWYGSRNFKKKLAKTDADASSAEAAATVADVNGAFAAMYADNAPGRKGDYAEDENADAWGPLKEGGFGS